MAWLKILVIEFWLLLIPLGIYVLLKFYVFYQHRKGNETLVERPVTLMVLVMTLLIMIASLAMIAMNTDGRNQRYVPNRFDNGILVPSEVESR